MRWGGWWLGWSFVCMPNARGVIERERLPTSLGWERRKSSKEEAAKNVYLLSASSCLVYLANKLFFALASAKFTIKTWSGELALRSALEFLGKQRKSTKINLIKSWLENTLILCWGRKLFALYFRNTIFFSPVEHLFIFLVNPLQRGARNLGVGRMKVSLTPSRCFSFTLNTSDEEKARACIIITVKADFFFISSFKCSRLKNFLLFGENFFSFYFALFFPPLVFSGYRI